MPDNEAMLLALDFKRLTNLKLDKVDKIGTSDWKIRSCMVLLDFT